MNSHQHLHRSLALAVALACFGVSWLASAQGVPPGGAGRPAGMRGSLRTLLPSSVAASMTSASQPCALPKFLPPFEGGLHFRTAYRGPGSASGFRSCPLWSTFGVVRGGSRFHGGIDVAAPTGTALHAAAEGTLSYARDPGGYGLFARLDVEVPKRSDDGVCTSQTTTVQIVYGHLLDDDPHLSLAPRPVRAGEVLGRVGCSGNAKGMCSPSPESHVHITVQAAQGSKTKLEPTAFLGWNVSVPGEGGDGKEVACREVPVNQLVSWRGR